METEAAPAEAATPTSIVVKSDSVSLLPEPPRPGLLRGILDDFHESSYDARTLIFAVLFFLACRLEGLAQAQEAAKTWRQNPWVCRLAVVYWPTWVVLTAIKTIGRVTLRLLSCSRTPPLSGPVREGESALEWEVRAIWAVSLTGWFVLVFLLSVIQAAQVPQGEATSVSVRHYAGIGTRVLIAAAFMAGCVTLLHAMRRRDLLLIRAIIAGYVSFAVTLLVMLIVFISVLATRPNASAVFRLVGLWIDIVFAGASAVVFLWGAVRGVQLVAEYAQDQRRESEAGPTRDLAHALGAVSLALLLSLFMIATNVWSVLADPMDYWSTIG